MILRELFVFLAGALFGAAALKLRQAWKAFRRMERADSGDHTALKRTAEAVKLAEQEGRRHGLK